MGIKKYHILILMCFLITVASCDIFKNDEFDQKSAKNIISFSFLKSNNSVLYADVPGIIIGTNISLTMPYGTDVSSLIADFEITGKSLVVNGVKQKSGKTPNNFLDPAVYTVIAEDGSQKNYTVSLLMEEEPTGKEITSFALLKINNTDLPADIFGTISGNDITLNVPLGTDITCLTADFITTGKSVIVNDVIQLSGITSNDFTNPLVYTVITKDGIYENYRVTVTTIAIDEKLDLKEINLFSFLKADNPVIPSDINGTISGSDIFLYVFSGTDITSLKASFITTGQSVTVDGVPQLSGITLNDFSNPVVYTVIAENGSSRNYTVTLTYINSIYAESMETNNASKWFGGDDRSNFIGRAVATGQSFSFNSKFVIYSFSVKFTNHFDYSGNPEFKGHEVNIILDIRDASGNIITSSNIVVPESFNGGWVDFNLKDKNLLLNANEKYIFTWFVENAEYNHINSGSSGNTGDLYKNGTGYSAQIYPGGNFKNWSEWYEHPWDFLFRVSGEIR